MQLQQRLTQHQRYLGMSVLRLGIFACLISTRLSENSASALRSAVAGLVNGSTAGQLLTCGGRCSRSGRACGACSGRCRSSSRAAASPAAALARLLALSVLAHKIKRIEAGAELLEPALVGGATCAHNRGFATASSRQQSR